MMLPSMHSFQLVLGVAEHSSIGFLIVITVNITLLPSQIRLFRGRNLIGPSVVCRIRYDVCIVYDLQQLSKN